MAPQEEREISPPWAIPVLLVLGLGGALALVMAITQPKEEVPPEEVPTIPPVLLANIHGVVTDAQTGAPLANVVVELWSSDGLERLLSTTTNSSGSYSMADIDPGNYLMRFAAGGYEMATGTVTLQEGDNEVNAALSPLAKAEFYMPAQIDVKVEDGTILDMYWNCIFTVPISNVGDAPGKQRIHVIAITDGEVHRDYTQEISLQPGQTYLWELKQWVDFRRLSYYKVTISGDWEADNYAEGVARR